MTTTVEATSSNKEIRLLMKIARAQGWRVTMSGNHLRWLNPDGQGRVTSSITPSENRALMNIRHDLKRAGLRF